MTNLQREREKRSWTKAELGRRARLNQNTIGQIESGRLRPYPGQIKKLARVLKVDPDWLLSEADGDRVSEPPDPRDGLGR